MLYPQVARLLFRLPPEDAHRLTLAALHGALATPGVDALIRRFCRPGSAPVEAFGQRFNHPIGLAAGFDKDARHVDAMAALGFAFVEVGSVTARACPGNERPRLFRLPEDGALINRMGLNNGGVGAAVERLRAPRPVPVFVNVAKTPDPALVEAAAINDYLVSIYQVAPVADVIVLNISCPNSGDGRTFESPEALAPLLDAARAALPAGAPPLVLKVSPDLDPGMLAEGVAVALERGVAGFTAVNTTVRRDGLRTAAQRLEAIGRGGLSGRPLAVRARETVARLRRLVGDAVPIVGVGGVRDADDARALLDCGATLVQLYTGLIYGGPLTVRRIVAGLNRRG